MDPVKIGVEDIKRLFTEINEQGMSKHERFWRENFTEEAYGYIADTVGQLLPTAMKDCYEKGGTPLDAISAFYIGGVMIGFLMKEQYGGVD